VTIKVKLLGHMDYVFITEFENREGLNGDIKDLFSAKLHSDILSSIAYCTE